MQAKRPLRFLAFGIAVTMAFPYSVHALGIELKIGGTRVSTHVPGTGNSGGTVTVDPSKPIPIPITPLLVPIPAGPITIPVGRLPLIPHSPADYTSHLIESSTNELGKVSGNIVREAGIGYANLEREAKKGATNVENNLRKAAGDVERTLRQAGGDVGRELKNTQGEVEDAAVAVYRFAVRQAESSSNALSEAEQRFREGKVVDAVWHLGLAPSQHTSENAAQAATESALLNTVGQAAASAYGGPGGAAAYAAWLAYYQTGGDVNVAMRVGLTAAVQSYASQYAQAPAAAGVQESFKKAAIGGALNGLAVAANGGSPADIQKAMFATAGNMLVQDGYQALSQNQNVATFARTAKQVYCVKALAEQTADKSCPSLNDYVKDAQDHYAMLDQKGVVQWVDLKKEIPGSEWLFLSRAEALDKAGGLVATKLQFDQLPIKEIDAKYKSAMNEVHKVKNANVLSLLEGRWALSYQPAKEVITDSLKAAVAPSVVLSYTGLSATELAKGGEAARKAIETPVASQPEEIITCAKDQVIERLWVSYGQSGDPLRCTVSQMQDNIVKASWYARNDGAFCRAKMLDAAKSYMDKGYSCHGR